MKKFGIFKIVTLLSLVAFVVALVSGVSIADMYEVFVVGAGGAASYATAVGALSTSNVDSAVLGKELESTIMMLRPDDNPLDQLIRSTKKVIPKNAWKVEWPYMDIRPFTDTVTVPNDAADATSDVIQVTTPSMWKVDDVVRFPGVNATSTSKPFVGQITAISGSTLTILAINGTSTNFYVPVIAAAQVMVRLGSAKDETAALTGVWNNSPSYDYNYMQVHMAQIEESILYGKHKKDVNLDFALQKANAMYDFRATMELNSIFGVRAIKTDGTSSKVKHFSHGVWNYIEQTLNYGKSTNPNEFFDSNWIDITKTLFTGKNGSSSRYLFADAELIARISKIDTVQKQIDAGKSVEVKHGITFNKVTTNFGELYIKHHKMLDEAYLGTSGAGGYGMAIDLPNLNKYSWEPMQSKVLNLDETGTSRSKAIRFHETFCLGLKNLATHAIIAPYGA